MELVPCEKCAGCLLRRPSSGKAAELSGLVNQIIYGQGKLIFQQGAPIFGFHIVGQGKVELFRRFKDGRKRLIRIAQQGDILDTAALQGEGDRSTFAEALTECQICLVPKKEFFSWIGCHPEIGMDLIQRLSQEIRQLQSELVDTSYMGIRERLVNLLLRLTHRQEGERLSTDLYEAQIAEMLGISRESVVRHLGWLRRKGIVLLEGRRVVIHDRERLSRLQVRF